MVLFTLRDAQHLSDGTPLSKVAEVINAAPQVVAVGLNCVALESVTPALQTLQALTDKPLLVYPNSGEQYDAVSKSWHSAPSGCTLHDKFPEWQQAGARLIGGCCRTTPGYRGDCRLLSTVIKRRKAPLIARLRRVKRQRGSLDCPF